MPFTPIMATLGYILSEDKQCVLMIHRNARPGDLHLGKYNGLGGKMDCREDVATCMAREIKEEAGIEVDEMVMRGTISWPGFGLKGEDWFGFIFLIKRWSGEPLTNNPEGTLEWVKINDLLAGKVPLWEGDKYFLPLVFDDQPLPFHGVMPYENGQLLRWSFCRT